MKTRILNIFWLLLLGVAVIAQEFKDKSFELDDNQSLDGTDKTYIGRDYIKLKQGFRFSTADGNKFNAKLNENLVLDVDYVTATDPTTRPIDQNLPVGTTAGSFAVSPTGAATYTIPIEVPPGTAGMQPSLAISYNSQGGDGVMGMGWNISGLSAITRSGQTIYHDSKVQGVNLDADDRFSYDGNRLVVKTGDYGADDSEYRTEMETFSKITVQNSFSTNNEWFKVETKDGKTIEYGNGNNSRIVVGSSGKAVAWMISKIIDNFGNYIKFTYKNFGNSEYSIDKIEYTINDAVGLSKYNSVNFYYEDKPNFNFAYIAGYKIIQSKLLYAIKTHNEGNLVKEYRCNYTYDQSSSATYVNTPRLIEISEFGVDGSKYNSTLIKWNQSASTLYTVNDINVAPNYSIYTGDFNGDGKTDFISYSKYLPPYKWYLYINEGNNTFSYKSSGPLSGSLLNSVKFSATMPNIDINGDGLDDVISVHINNNPDAPADAFPIKYTYLYSSGESFYSLQSVNYSTGDNRIAYPGRFSNWRTDLKDYWNGWEMYPIDFNGNGKTDILEILKDEDANAGIFEYTSATSAPYIYSSGYPTRYHRIFPGDFNGDGKTDLLTYSTGYNWNIGYSTGTGFVEKKSPITKTVDPEASVYDYLYFVRDFNGDGKDDILEAYRQNGKTILNMYHNIMYDGDNCNSTCITVELDENLHKSFFEFGDFNGDGKQDIMYQSSVYFPPKIISFYPNNKKYLVNSITNGLNNTTEIQYEPLTDDLYTKGTYSTGSHSIITAQIPLYVVSNIKYPNGVGIINLIGNKNSIFYEYTGAIISNYGKGFLGFEKTIVKKFNYSTSGVYYAINEKVNDVNSDYHLLELKSEKVSIDGQDISFAEYEPKVKLFQNKRIFPYIRKITLNNYLPNKVIITDNFYPYDECDYCGESAKGNVSEITINYNNESTETASFTYISDDSRVSEKTVSQQEGTDPAFTRKVNYYYNTNGSLLQQITDNDKTKKVTTDYEYTGHGNVKKVTVSASDIDSRITMYDYDSKGRFLEKTTVPFGDINFITESRFDSRTGNLIWSKNVNNLVTSYKYDGFGRLTETTLPNLKKVKNSLHWCDGTNPVHSRYYSLAQADGHDDVKTYYDILGREIRSESTAYDGSILYADKSYNQKGELVESTEPYKTGSDYLSVEYDYKTDGRINHIYNKLNGSVFATTSYDYAGSTTTISKETTAGIQTSSKTYDTKGRITDAVDNGETISYTYHSLSTGLKTEINYGSTKTIKTETDEYGMQKSLDDPDAGKIDYIYNSIGELISQTDARSNNITMTYDILGRIKTKTSPEGLTEYQYDSKTYGKGLLASVSNDNLGTSVEYTYNQYGQPTIVKETIDGLNFTTKYDYNIYGAVTKITYPSNSSSSTPFSVTQNYNSRGYMTEVTNSADGASIWKLDAINTRGQLTGYTLGNGIGIINTFDNYGYLEENNSDDDVTIDQKYSFDPVTGNMNWRKNLPLYYWEIFTYDNSNRLTKSLFGNGDEKNIDYKPNSNGNIDFKTDIGNYFYDGTQPHAVSQVSNTAGLISENIQDIDYNSFNKVSKITEDLNTLDFVYGIDNERRKTIYKENGTTTILTKYYSTNYEKQITATNTRELHYIFAGDGLCAVYEKNTPTGSSTSSSNMYYTHKDYLGSITEITDKDGALLQRINYDAWGKRTLTYNNSVFSDFILDRGYTGHEHLPQFSLINMNGRLYDPMLGRMLSPDNYVQFAGYSQSFNRYSYALNNPMKFTDPSGEFIAESIMIGIFIGAVIIGYSGGSSQQIMEGAIVGGIAGGSGAYVGAAVGGIVGAGFIGGAAGGAAGGFTSGFITGAGNSWVMGDSFEEGLNTGLKTGGTGAVSGALVGGISGGISAVNHGGDFWTGVGATYPVYVSDVPNTGGADPVEYNNSSAKQFSDQYIGKVKGLNNLYADNSVPDGYTLNGDFAIDAKNKAALGVAEYIGKGQSDVYLYKGAFVSKEKLYLVMKHEYIHVGFNNLGRFSYKKQENSARRFMLDQAKAWNSSHTAGIESIQMQGNYPRYNYSILGITILNKTPW